MPDARPVEGFLSFHGFRVWYRIVGEREDPGKSPLLVLHGGPGAAHDYLEPLAAIATGRRVIFYDQLGCGKSDKPHNPSMWTVGLFVEEIGVVRRALGLPRIHLLGQSWGGMLAMEHALDDPPGLRAIVVADSPASIPLWVSEANRLRADLPPDVQETLTRHEEAGTTDDPEYETAMLVFYARHVCRVAPMPDCLQRSFAQLAANPTVYQTMNGPSEFHVIGTLRAWDITDRLHEISTPTLLLSGRHDEATPRIVGEIHDRIPGARWVLFEESSHMPHLEEPEAFLETVESFLHTIDG